ncbi:MAG: tryptophanyl-tRNA synthetase [Paraburkholderia sp.]|nr:tryptophanyl-tRNA synthetase [Paraburkholderia sp.]
MTTETTDMRQRILTGITTTGIPHLGNYIGAIRPAIAASSTPTTESFFFLADYHGLVKCDDPVRLSESRIEVAAAWLAAGLDPARTYFYRQSDVPETLELYWLLTCLTSKGLMNRAHAYKAAIDSNESEGEDIDAGVTMGLYCYPILMAADILLFRAHKVPVGRDQLQHLEMTRDIAQRFNQLFGGGKQVLTLPEAVVSEEAVLPGLDGRKMSKSYGNTIPLFAGGDQALVAGVSKIVTDSRLPGEPKDPDSNPIFALYSAFAGVEAATAFRAELAGGLGWGEAKSRLVQCIENELAPMREHYDALMTNTGQIEDTLQAGAEKARVLARSLLEELRDAIGLRSFKSVQVGDERAFSAPAKTAPVTPKPPTMRQYREADGSFHFKLIANGATVLLKGGPFGSGAEAGRCIRALRDTAGDTQGLPEQVSINGELSADHVEAGLRAWIDSSAE